MRYRKYKIGIPLLMLLFLVSACVPTELESSDSPELVILLEELKGKPLDELPAQIRAEVSDSVGIDADIIAPKKGKDATIAGLEVEGCHFSDTEIRANMDLLIRSVSKFSGYSGQVIEKEDEPLYGRKSIRLDLSLGALDGVFTKRDSCWINTIEGYLIQGPLIPGFGPEEMQHWFEKDKELDFMSVEEAKQSAKGLLESCGAPYLNAGTCYTLDYAAMNRILEECPSARMSADVNFISAETAYEGVKREYGEDDEAYYVDFEQEYGEIRFCPYRLGEEIVKTEWGLSPVCYVVYTKKDGLAWLRADDMCKVIGESSSDVLLPLSGILEDTVRSLTPLSAAGTVEIKEISLNYVPVLDDGDSGRFTAVPAWVFAYHYTQYGSDYAYDSYCVYNAWTGESMH